MCVLQVIEWFEEYAEEFFQTHTELGDSYRVAETLADEVLQFEDSTQVRKSSTFCCVYYIVMGSVVSHYHEL